MHNSSQLQVILLPHLGTYGKSYVLYLGTGGCYWHLQIEEAKDVVPHLTVNRTSRYRNKNANQNANHAR